MPIKLSKGIGEIQGDELRYIWQAPDVYDEVHDNNVWLIYGRKGSGKSTLVEYLGSDSQNSKVITIRPRKTNLFQKVLVAINEVKDDDRLIEESISNTIEFILFAQIMRSVVGEANKFISGGNLETIYNFLCQYGLHQGSVLRKAISLISKQTGKISLVPDISQLLNTLEGDVEYEDAKDALIEYTKEINKSVVLCIDDIDQIGFSFSRYDRLFVNGLLILMGRNNVNFIESGAKIRIFLTIPSELYFHSTMWGADWITGKSNCLNWDDPKDMLGLVNKRIAMEMNVRKHHKRSKDDIYSIDSDKTWNRIFPTSIKNKLNRDESSFDYLLRHTFYTPRHMLALCDKVLTRIEHEAPADIDLFDLGEQFSLHHWNDIFRKSVREFTEEAEKDFRAIFNNIYENLEKVISAFKSRPGIWNRAQLIQFIEKEGLKISRKDKGIKHESEDLVYILHRIGFLGLGVRRINEAPTGSQAYELKFSYLERLPYKGGWELAVVSPVFYTTYDIRPVDHIVVNPHKDLLLPVRILQSIMSYDIVTNNSLANC